MRKSRRHDLPKAFNQTIRQQRVHRIHHNRGLNERLLYVLRCRYIRIAQAQPVRVISLRVAIGFVLIWNEPKSTGTCLSWRSRGQGICNRRNTVLQCQSHSNPHRRIRRLDYCFRRHSYHRPYNWAHRIILRCRTRI